MGRVSKTIKIYSLSNKILQLWTVCRLYKRSFGPQLKVEEIKTLYTGLVILVIIMNECNQSAKKKKIG